MNIGYLMHYVLSNISFCCTLVTLLFISQYCCKILVFVFLFACTQQIVDSKGSSFVLYVSKVI